MAQKKYNKNTPEEKPLVVYRPCYDCGEECHTFHWAPNHWTYCPECSKHQKGYLKFPRLEDLRRSLVDVQIWGD